MLVIHNRLDPASNDISRALRKHNLTEIHAAIELAEEIGTRAAAKAMGINYTRLVRFRLADRRRHQTLAQALADLERGWPKCWSPELVLKVAALERARLMLRVEAAREGCRIAQRTGAKVWKCIEQAGNHRGMNGESLCKLVMDGRIPKHWIQ